ncbi:MAG: MFS transporter [Candidatus Abyssubacteria bacterium]
MTRIYYGWWIVAATFSVLFVCAGIGFFTYPVFIKYIDAEMQWGRDSLSNAGAISALAAGFATPPIGYVIDRFGARAVMLPGAILLSTCYFLLSRINSIGGFYLLFLLIGIGMAATTILPSQTLVSKWFDRKRGRAMGMVTLAGGLGGVIWIRLSTTLIETMNWRRTYEILGALILAISFPLILFVIRNSPHSMGLKIEGGDDETTGTQVTQPIPIVESGYSIGEAIVTKAFWLIVLSTFSGVFAGSGFGLHVIAFLTDSGLSSKAASTLWSFTLGMSIASTFFFGFFSEKRQKRYLAGTSQVVRALCLVLLILIARKAASVPPGAMPLILFAVVYGLSLGCLNVVSPLLISETFGIKAFGKVMGMLGIPFTVGMALGQVVGGRLFVLHNNYIGAFSVFAIALFLAGVSIGFVKPRFSVQAQRVDAGSVE